MRKSKLVKIILGLALGGAILFGGSSAYTAYTDLESQKTELAEKLESVESDYKIQVVALKEKTEELDETQSTLEKAVKEKKTHEDKVKELNNKVKSLEEELSFKIAARKEAERKAAEEKKQASQSKVQTASLPETGGNAPAYTEPVANTSNGALQFGGDGLLVMSGTGAAQNVINLLLGIPGHANGAGYHASTGLDGLIDSLSIPEAVYVVHRIEGAGFGQTGDGYAGQDSPSSHQAFVNNQVNNRFGGDIKLLLKKWGTFSYGGY